MISIERLRERFDVDPEAGTITWKHRPSSHVPAGAEAGSLMRNGYMRLKVDGKQIYCHRVMWAVSTGKWPVGDIDHINGDRTDNRISNLREVFGPENQRNKSMMKNNKSGANGVRRSGDGKKWRADLQMRGKFLALGYFDRFEDAVAARKKAERAYGFHENHGRPRVEG